MPRVQILHTPSSNQDSRLTEEKILQVREYLGKGHTQSEISRALNISQSTVSTINTKRHKRQKTGLPATMSGLITQALRRAQRALDRDGIVQNISDHHNTNISPDSVRRTTNEMVATGRLVQDGKLYSLPSQD